MAEYNWAVGMEVAWVFRGLGELHVSKHTITRIMKRWIELDYGRKFDLFGHTYPRPDYTWSRSGPHVVPWTEEHAKLQKASRVKRAVQDGLESLLTEVRKTDVTAKSLARLEAIAAALNSVAK